MDDLQAMLEASGDRDLSLNPTPKSTALNLELYDRVWGLGFWV